VNKLFSLLTGWGVPARAAKPVGFVGIGIIVLIVLWGAKCMIEKQAVDSYQTQVELNAAVEDRKADQKAADQAAKDEDRLNYEADQMEEAVKNAPKDPAIPDDRERALAFHRCLSLQQRARANGLQPPRCV